MKVWEVEVWIKIKKSSPWENWEKDKVVAETIEEAIEKSKAKQKEAWQPEEIEVRSAHLELETTID